MAASASMVMFQKTLQDLVKGIRSHKRDESPYISQAIVEIKAELKSTDPFTKAEAVRKLTYLQMLGYNFGWASFGIVEVMSSPRFAHKRIGYLAANQSFNDATDVILLTTNLFKKEFTSTSPASEYEIGLAVNCLANIVTKDLARDCIGDLVQLMSSTRSYVRKKAVLAMYKLFVKYPQGLRLTFEQLKERLDDPDGAVVSSAVNVICELADKNPRNYLGMAPVFFRLMTTSSNNWMLIKVVKLFGSLVPEEPRLARKLLDPLITIITNTSAKSLQYECINTVIQALPYTKREDGSEAKNASQALKTCSTYIRGFIEDDDQNLKYLGLVGLIRLMSISPLIAVEHRDLVLHCLSDEDVTIRSRALELLAGMVTKKSLVDLVQHLLQFAEKNDGHYRAEIMNKIIQMAMKEKHALVTDFAWYLSVLYSLSRLINTSNAWLSPLIGEQLADISLRVPSVRPYAVELMLNLLLDPSILTTQHRDLMADILDSAAWIVGEYSDVLNCMHRNKTMDSRQSRDDFWIDGPFDKPILSKFKGKFVQQMAMRALLHPVVSSLPAKVQSAYLFAAMKIFVHAIRHCERSELASLVCLIRLRLSDSKLHGTFAQSSNLDVEEKRSFFLQLFFDLNILFHAESNREKNEKDLIEFDRDVEEDYSANVIEQDNIGASQAVAKCSLLEALFAEAFYPVHVKAQKNVPLPPGLNLSTAFNESALDDFLQPGTQSDSFFGRVRPTSLAQVAFLPGNFNYTPGAMVGIGSGYSGTGDIDEGRLSRVLGETTSTDYSKSGATSSTPLASYSTASSTVVAPSKQSGDSSLFYLNSGKNELRNTSTYNSAPISTDTPTAPSSSTALSSEAAPLSALLASGYDMSQSGRKKKEHKHRSSKKAHIQAELAPVSGNLSSDEDEKKKASKKSKRKTEDPDEDEMDLENVDITVPLRPHEVIPVLSHRQSASAAPEEHREVVEAKTKKDKKERKNKSEKEHKSHKKQSAEQSANSTFDGDLLGLGGSSTVPVNPVVDTQSVSGTKEKSSSRSKSKSDKDGMHLWSPLYLSGISKPKIYYLTSRSRSRSDNVELVFVVVNDGPDSENSTVSVSIDFSSAAVLSYDGKVVRDGSGKDYLILCQNLKASKSEVSGTAAIRLQAPIADSSVQVSCNVRVQSESLIGSSDSSYVQSTITLSPCAGLSEYKMSEDEFETLLVDRSRSKMKFCGAASEHIAIDTSLVEDTSSKQILKAIVKYTNSFVVSKESSKAISATSRASGDGVVCFLIKILSHSNESAAVLMDVKYFSNSSSLDVNMKAREIVSSLRNLVIM